MSLFICPLCRAPLNVQPKSWSCGQGHSFDVAREGYVNLLPVQHKHSRKPGDNADMVLARRAFLQAGFYAPLRDALVALLRPLQAQTLLDIGCGEGYYSVAFSRAVPEVIGVDIAKPAIRLAAKSCREVIWLVGSSALLPLADASIDCVSSLFSPLPIDEILRVLKPTGTVLLVTPAPEHLWTLRQQLFETVQAHEPDKFLADFEAQFELRHRSQIEFELRLAKTSLKQLLLMTPYAWRAKPDRRAALESSEKFTTSAAFTVLLLQKKT
jgi:23S rRNA (guanine745-N1)-methyltransferase